jgi:tungstate transport system ATP-binding protein
MNQTASAMVDIQGISVVRGGTLRAQVESLSLKRGEVLAIMGPNGAGKSSLLLALALLIDAKWERYAFDGTPVDLADRLALRRKMAVVFQEALLLDTTVVDNVMMGLMMRGASAAVARSLAIEWLERLGVGPMALRRARTLSGGEAQRVSLARAFAMKPDLLLMDEPFSGLDVLSRLSLLKEIVPLLAETDTSCVFVTHDFTEAALIADRVMVMDAGRPVQTGTPLDVLEKPATPLVATLVEFAGTIASLLAKKKEQA